MVYAALKGMADIICDSELFSEFLRFAILSSLFINLSSTFLGVMRFQMVTTGFGVR